MMDVLEAIEKRSSTRGYGERRLSEETLEKILLAGLQAPTAANRQEVHFTVVKGDNPILAEIEEERLRIGNMKTPPHNFYYEAPTVLILSAMDDFYWSILDAGIATANITLAAEGLGLGSLIIGCIKDAMNGEKKEYFAKALGFPEGYAFRIAIALGYKALEKEPHTYDREKNVTIL